MWKQFGSKNLLRALTAFCLVSSLALISGCAGLGIKKSETFFPEYYAAKRLDNADIIKLRGFASSVDPYVSSSATLLLGIHYLRYGDRSYGRILIDKSYNDKVLDPQMKLFGKLWKMESLLGAGDRDGARKIALTVTSMKKDEVYMRTLKIYCLNSGTVLEAGENPDKCIEARFEPQKTDALPADSAETSAALPAGEDDITSGGTDNMTYEEYLAAMGLKGGEPEPVTPDIAFDAVINVVGGDLMNDEVQGVIYGINRLGAGFKVNAVSENSDEASDESAIRIYPGRMEIAAADRSVQIGVDWAVLTDAAANLKRAENFQNIAVCSSTSKIQYARYLKPFYEERGKKVSVFNYDNPAFQSQLRAFLESDTDSSVLIIGMGEESEIISFLPVARFLQTGKNQEILLATSSLTGIYFNRDYGSYFRDVYILTPVQTTDDRKFNEMNVEFEAFFGSQMNLKNLLGYDAVAYVNSLIKPEDADKYLTNISGFVDDAAYRSVGFYKINKKLQVNPLQLETVSNY